VIEYADQGIYANRYVTGTVSNSTLRYNNVGIYLQASGSSLPQLTITFNTFQYNNTAGLYLSGYGSSSVVLDVNNNWWGTANPVLGSTNGVDVYYDSTNQSVAPINSPAQVSISGPNIINVAITDSYLSPGGNSATTSTSLTATLDQSASWAVEVLNASQAVVRTFSESGTAVNVNWDGKNTSNTVVPDGQYTMKITSTSGNGPAIPVTLTVFVDSALPTADISNTLNGVNATPLMNISGTAIDTYFSSYQLAYGAGASPSTYTPIGTPAITSINNDTLINWNTLDGTGTPLLPNGAHTVQLTVTDKAGNTATDQISVNFNNVIVNTVSFNTTATGNITVDPAAGELANVDFSLNNPATVFVRWYEENTDALVKEISQSLTAGSYTIPWDGTDNAGQLVPNNAYYFKIYATDGTSEITYSVPGSGTPEIVSIPGSFGNTINAYTNELFKSTFTAPSPACDGGCRTQLKVTDPSNSANNFIALDGQYEPGTYTVGWNLRDLTGQLVNGSRTVLLTDFVKLKPNSIIVKNSTNNFTIKGTGTHPEIEIKSDPYVVYHSYEQFSKVEYDLDRNAYVTITILPPNIIDPNDPSAIVVQASILQAASVGGTPYSFTWAGYIDAAGLRNDILVSEEGAYSYLIEAASEANGAYTSYAGFITMFH